MVCPLLYCVFYITDECLEALHVVRGIIPNLRHGVSVKIVNALNPLLATVGLEQRLCICDIYDALSSHDSSMRSLVIICFTPDVVSSVSTFPIPVPTYVQSQL
jgi:U3 small nucleolar RNA-associated protein 20